MALALRQPGTEKSQSVYQGFSRDGLSYELASKTDEQKAVAISELAAKGENFIAYHLDNICAELQRSHSPEIKQAVCKAIMAAGSAAVPFYQEIADLVNDHNAEVRYWGCLALGSLGPTSVGSKGKIRGLLDDPSEAVRFGACSALGGMKAEDCVEDLKAKLADSSPEVQGAACLALGKLGVAGTPCAALVAQKLAEPRSRANALKALSLMGLEGGKHSEAVCECLTDEDAETRVLTASVVGKMADYIKESPDALNRILDLTRDEDGRKRTAAALALGYMGKDAAVHKDVIQDLLMDEFEEEADNALTLGGCRPRMPPSCRKAKCAAAAALGRIAAEDRGFGWEAPAEHVARLLDSDDWEVRLCALDCFASLGKRASAYVQKVVGQFTDEKFVIRSKAARAFGKIGETESISLNKLADMLQDNCPAVKCEAALALAELGDDGAEHSDKVFDLFIDFNAEVRAAAITALSRMGEKGQYYATAIAQKVTPEEEPRVRIAAIEALSIMEERGSAFKELISEQQQDELPSVRDAAVRSLEKMGQPEGYTQAIQDQGDEE